MRYFFVYVALLFVAIIVGVVYLEHKDDQKYEFLEHCKRKYTLGKYTQYNRKPTGKVDFKYQYDLGKGEVEDWDERHWSNLPSDTCTYFFISFCPEDTLRSWTIETDMPFDTSYKYGQLYDTIIGPKTN